MAAGRQASGPLLYGGQVPHPSRAGPQSRQDDIYVQSLEERLGQLEAFISRPVPPTQPPNQLPLYPQQSHYFNPQYQGQYQGHLQQLNQQNASYQYANGAQQQDNPLVQGPPQPTPDQFEQVYRVLYQQQQPGYSDVNARQQPRQGDALNGTNSVNTTSMNHQQYQYPSQDPGPPSSLHPPVPAPPPGYVSVAAQARAPQSPPVSPSQGQTHPTTSQAPPPPPPAPKPDQSQNTYGAPPPAGVPPELIHLSRERKYSAGLDVNSATANGTASGRDANDEAANGIKNANQVSEALIPPAGNATTAETEKRIEPGNPVPPVDLPSLPPPPPPPPPPQAKARLNRIRTIINRWNDDRSKWEKIEEDLQDNTDASDKVVTYTRHMDAGNEKQVDYEEIVVDNKELKELLADTDPCWSDVVSENQQISCITPFFQFVWSWDKYIQASEPRESDSPALEAARKDLAGLLDLIRGSTARGVESYFRTREMLKASKKVKFEHLWTIFPHGSKVYARSYLNELQMFEVKEVSDPPLRGKRFRVTCSAFDWDGSKFSPHSYDFYIREFSGEKLIGKLDIYPCEYFVNQDGKYDDTELKQHLIDRGKRYIDLCTTEPITYQCKYEGTAIVSPTGPHRLSTKGRGMEASRRELHDAEEVDVTSIDITGKQSRVIIDNYAFLKSERNPMKRGDMPPLGKKIPFVESDCVCAICKSSTLQQWRPEAATERSLQTLGKEFLKDEIRLMFLPPRLLGFALKDKVWGQFLVDKLTPIGFVDDDEHRKPFWDELQLENDSKEQLMAEVRYHKATTFKRPGEDDGAIDIRAFDVIEGKGQGLAILLHGPPGVGKTLTAETIAIATGRPLLTVSVAEIGVEAHEAERKLTDVFEDAARWEAVLLMDEADVFVEERMKGDLHRNALVSVLLRCLEYYDGIIILTTNRVRSIDAAVQSRIQLAIQYHDLRSHQRLAIYKNRLRYIPDDEFEDRRALEKKLENSPLVKERNKANGRQIRNIVTGARRLAKSKGEALSLKHLVTVHDTTSDFINGMAELMQKQRAKNELDYEK